MRFSRRSRRTIVPRPSLFSFLAVLVCLIGVLMFLAVAIVPTSLETAESNMVLEIKHISVKHEKKPRILECIKGMARSLNGEEEYTFTEDNEKSALNSGKWEGTPFTDFLNDLCQNRKQEYVLFVVRPEGLSIFRTLRGIILQRNRDKCFNSISITEKPSEEMIKQLPAALRRKVNYIEGKLTFSRVMSLEERDTLKAIFSDESSKKALDQLFEKSQTATDWVNYGSELVPAEWAIRSARAVSQSQPDNTNN